MAKGGNSSSGKGGALLVGIIVFLIFFFIFEGQITAYFGNAWDSFVSLFINLAYGVGIIVLIIFIAFLAFTVAKGKGS